MRTKVQYYLPLIIALILMSACETEKHTIGDGNTDTDRNEDLVSYTAEFNYNGSTLKDLRIPSGGAQGILEMISSTGKIETDGILYLRAADGISPWVSIVHTDATSGEPGGVYHGRPDTFLKFEENTGEKRQMTAEFYSKKTGTVYYRARFTQEAPASLPPVEEYPFDLVYELNLELNTVDDKFKTSTPYSDYFYPDLIEIFNPGTSTENRDETVKVYSNNYYGFVADAPGSYNKVVVKDITSPLLIYPGYRGTTTNQFSDGIVVKRAQIHYPFFRNISYTLPIPAGVKRSQIIVYTMVINNLIENGVYDTPIITYEIRDR